MPYRKLSLGLCAVLACGIGVMAASAQQLNPAQIQQIEHLTSVICTTVKEQKGSASRDQLQADVNAKIGGVVGKIIPSEAASKDRCRTRIMRGCRETRPPRRWKGTERAANMCSIRCSIASTSA